jgi:uncharacterized protein YcaQ
MKRIVHPKPDLRQEVADNSQNLDTTVFDVEALLEKGGLILQREITNLMMESSGKKLSSASSRDLVAYLRLLSDLQKDQKQKLEQLTDEELVSLTSQAEPSTTDPQK